MNWLELLERLSLVLGATLGLLYLYQSVYLAVGLLRRGHKKAAHPVSLLRYAVLIAARNEEGVIGELIESLRQQDYPAELLDIYVVADNCTDGTARRAAAAGASKVFVRRDSVRVGKGYALDFLWHKLAEAGLEGRYAGYFVFDADNLVGPRFVQEMNRTFQSGDFAAVTGYRNSKNFGDNWISAGYSLWFLRETRFVNAARMALGLSCAVSGTGYLISADLLREAEGWPWHLLTEDLQLTAQQVSRGRRIGYCEGAVFYDEQPTSFRQSWTQRERWSKGSFQVARQYAPDLLRGVLMGGRRGFSCYDALVTIASVFAVLFSALASVGFAAAALVAADTAVQLRLVLTELGHLLGRSVSLYYRGMFLCGALVVLSEWRSIRASIPEKLGYLATFPLFAMTFLPITVVSFFHKVEWKPIRHKASARLKLDPAA